MVLNCLLSIEADNETLCCSHCNNGATPLEKEVDTTLRGMFEALQTKFPCMGLDEDQEVYIVERTDRSIQSVRGIEDQSVQVFDSIQDQRQALAQESAAPEINGPTDEVHSVELC
ncbi:MAG: hypothetical protein ACJAYE_003302 [Candidatus Azotimanducaceae bacterium]|jgi:hypothetical protein